MNRSRLELTWLPIVFAALTICVLQCSPAFASDTVSGCVAAGCARFTVITPNLIRIEYAPAHDFVDPPFGLCDGVVGGYPGAKTLEWACGGHNEGAWARLDWQAPVEIR